MFSVISCMGDSVVFILHCDLASLCHSYDSSDVINNHTSDLFSTLSSPFVFCTAISTKYTKGRCVRKVCLWSSFSDKSYFQSEK